MLRRLVVLATALVGVGVLSAMPASAAPSNAKNALVFTDVVCTNVNPPNVFLVVDFTVNGGGRAGAHTDAGIFQPTSLTVFVNGQLEQFFTKPQQGDWVCDGQATVTDPESGQDVVITFTASGFFKPNKGLPGQ